MSIEKTILFSKILLILKNTLFRVGNLSPYYVKKYSSKCKQIEKTLKPIMMHAPFVIIIVMRVQPRTSKGITDLLSIRTSFG